MRCGIAACFGILFLVCGASHGRADETITPAVLEALHDLAFVHEQGGEPFLRRLPTPDVELVFRVQGDFEPALPNPMLSVFLSEVNYRGASHRWDAEMQAIERDLAALYDELPNDRAHVAQQLLGIEVVFMSEAFSTGGASYERARTRYNQKLARVRPLNPAEDACFSAANGDDLPDQGYGFERNSLMSGGTLTINLDAPADRRARCVDREFLRLLGLTGSTKVKRPSMFGDETKDARPTAFDEQVLRTLYAPNLFPGISYDEMVLRLKTKCSLPGSSAGNPFVNAMNREQARQLTGAHC